MEHNPTGAELPLASFYIIIVMFCSKIDYFPQVGNKICLYNTFLALPIKVRKIGWGYET